MLSSQLIDDRPGATYSAVVKLVEQRDEEGPPVLAVGPDHGEEVRAEGRAGAVLPETSENACLGACDGLLHLVRHLHPRHSLHLYNRRR